MATGGDLSRTLEGGHEPFYDFPCSLCGNEGRHVEAARYCEECFVYMCDNCVRTIHNKIPLNTRHKLLDKGQFTVMNQSALKSFPTKRCLKHPGELVNIFCGNHDVVCCSACKALDHSTCNKTQHLPDAAKGIKRSNEYQNIRKETNVFLSDLNNLLDDRKASRSRIDKEKQQVKRTIADFRKKANTYFDDLEQKSLNELNLKETSIISRLEQDKRFLDKTKAEAKDILQQLDSFRGDNECELFFQVKSCKCFIQESTERVENISSTAPEYIVFQIDASIEKYLSSLDTFGSFDVTHSVTAQPFAVVSGTKTSSAQRQNTKVTTNLASFIPTKFPSGHYDQLIQYKTQLFRKCYVKEKYDTSDCFIYDICQLLDGIMLITDYNNKKLKRLDQSYELFDFVKLPGRPLCICATGPCEAAVSLCEDKKVQFVSVGRKLSLTRSFTTGNFCRGMVYLDDKLYICCGSSRDQSSGYIEVYNNTGHLHHSLPHASQRLSVVPKYISVSDDAQHLFVTSMDTDDISMLDLAGNVVNTFSSNELTYPVGIYADDKDQVFVCGNTSNTVVQFLPKQQKIEVILTRADGVLKPVGLHYDRKMSRLLISCDGSNNLLAYTRK